MLEHFKITSFTFLVLFTFPGLCQVSFEQMHNIEVQDAGNNVELPWIGGLNSSLYNSADLDGDNQDELILYDRSGNVYQIFKIEQNTFVPANEMVVYLPQIPEGWILFVDYNNDNRKDIFSNGDRGIIVYKNISQPGGPAAWKKIADPLLTTGFSGKINLIANAADVPAISDIDSDGDYDILVYNFAIGGHIRYNKNLSIELFGHADSLEYEINTRTWGQFEECECNLFAFNGETCEELSNGRVMHAGGKALLAYDDDGDGDKDLLVGHEQCIELYYYENMGDADSAYMTGYSNSFPRPENPANFHIFPAGFFEDLDFDGTKDLVVTPGFSENVEYKIDFSHSNWFYKNIGDEDNPDFVYQKNNLLQEKMLDFGENSVPAFSDLNADGRIDLLIASNGYWNGEVFSGQVIHMENNGAVDSPSFIIKNKDFLNLSSLKIINPRIDFVDFNGDNALDLTYSGFQLPNQIFSRVYINQATAGQPFEFDQSQSRQINLPESATIGDNPTYFDVNEDGFADLLLGKNGGALEYFTNNGDDSYILNDPAFLGIDRDFSLERLNMVASIGDLDMNGKADLIATDRRGEGRVYFDFQSQSGDFISVDLTYKNPINEEIEKIKFDRISWVSTSSIFQRNNESMMVGGARGGVQFFKNTAIGGGGNGVSNIIIKIYPNPIGDYTGLNIISNQDVNLELISVLGQTIVGEFRVQRFTNTVLDINHLSNGTYILRSKTDSGASKSQLLMVVR